MSFPDELSELPSELPDDLCELPDDICELPNDLYELPDELPGDWVSDVFSRDPIDDGSRVLASDWSAFFNGHLQ